MTVRPRLPDNLPVVERHVVRVVVQDGLGKILLFRTEDANYPELGSWWELPGGGIESGENYADAAIRELGEETGLVVDKSQIGPPQWRRLASFRHRGERRLQHEVVALVQLDTVEPMVDTTGQLPDELEDYVGWKWHPIQDVVGSDERFYPGQLPVLIARFLEGQSIDEPFELWS